MPTRYWTEVHASEILTLVVTIVFSYCVTTVGVSRARCGERIPSLGIWNWLTRQLEMLAISRKEPSRFRTAIEAQFWYEWRLKGLVLPCLTSVVLLIVPRLVQSDRPIDGRRERIESPAPAQAGAKCVDVLAHHPQVVHDSTRWYASRERPEPAVRIEPHS